MLAGAFEGLTSREASRRLERDGPNTIAGDRRRGVSVLALELLREPMILLLCATGGIYFALGDPVDATVLLVSIVAVAGISLLQSRRTERSLEKLRDLSSPRARVIRDGAPQRIAGSEVVRGDLLVVSEGDRVAADGILRWLSHVQIDESILTGESIPVMKVLPESGDTEARDARVFAGTLVVSGQGLAEVTETGPATEMGRIGKSLQSIVVEKSPLQREIGRLVRVLAAAGGLVCVLVVLLQARSRGLLEGLLAGLAVAMSLLPEEFPVVFTVFLALGAWRLSRQRVLTRRIPAIEALGAATVLCADKTGTLTLNRMNVSHLVAEDASLDVADASRLPEGFHEIVEFAVLASQRTPYDPMEQAIQEFGRRTLARTEHLHEDWELLREYPLSSELLAVAHAWKARGRDDFVIAAKGAPEAIADLCHLPAADARRLETRVHEMARDGLRVLAVAKARFHPASLPARSHDFDFRLLGLLGLDDPLRPSAREAIEDCRTAGVRVVMITGDYPVTAARIAREIGLPDAPPMTGADLSALEALDDAALGSRLEDTSVFARISPGQKLRLVQAFQARGDVVAMTGDGVNDAPALKAAHIGIAMGGRGTDVARESAALVLVDDSFSSIVGAIRLGRRIFDNLKKATAYLVAVHVPIAGLALAPVLFGWPLLLLPIQIVFLELVIDPASSIAFEAEPEEGDLMRRPPRDARASLISAKTLLLAAIRGGIVLAVSLAVYGGGMLLGRPVGASRGAAFASLIVGNLGLILAHRSIHTTVLQSLAQRNRALWSIVGLAAATLILVLAVPALRDLFRFSGLRPSDSALGIAAGATAIAALELLDRLRPRGHALTSI